MTSSHQHGMATLKRPWLVLMVAVVVLALAVSLVGRVFHGNISDGTRVTCNNSYAKCQHLDRDAHDWTTISVQSIGLPLAVTFVLPGRKVSSPRILRSDNCLYKRPPPSC